MERFENFSYIPLIGGRKLSLEDGMPDGHSLTLAIREKLTCFFMNPIEKWKLRGCFPWKLSLQVVIIFICFWQMYSFGNHRSQHVKVTSDLTSTLSKVLLKDWVQPDTSSQRNNPSAVYSVVEFYDHVDNAVMQYLQLRSLTTGSYDYDADDSNFNRFEICLSQYDGVVDPVKSFIGIKSLPAEKCWNISSSNPVISGKYWLKEFLKQSKYSLKFGTFIYMKLNFYLKAAFIKSLNKLGYPECFKLKVQVEYDNSNHDGPIPVLLSIKSTKLNCQIESSRIIQDKYLNYYMHQILNVCVIVLSFISITLCTRSICRGYKLFLYTERFFKYYLGKDIPFNERLDFIDFWYVLIIAGDILLLLASVIKLKIEEKTADTSEYTTCSVFLGIGYLMILIGTLRYFKFFPRYNVLILTLKKSLPNTMRFLICIFLLFIGYCFCGWIVLAPFHTKFLTLSSTAEGLFAAMNGDDVFGTFVELNTEEDFIWWFSRIYLYSFFFLFLYLAASLLISVIMDTFEAIKQSYVHGETPSTTVEIFLAASKDDYVPILSLRAYSDEDTENVKMSVTDALVQWLIHRGCLK